jgi:hypothetical protein
MIVKGNLFLVFLQKTIDLFGVKQNTNRTAEEKENYEDSSDSDESYYAELDDEESSSEDEEDIPDSVSILYVHSQKIKCP